MAESLLLREVATPTGGNYEVSGVPAPPRDPSGKIGDLLHLFQLWNGATGAGLLSRG
jgi:hypothetical protein